MSNHQWKSIQHLLFPLAWTSEKFCYKLKLETHFLDNILEKASFRSIIDDFKSKTLKNFLYY